MTIRSAKAPGRTLPIWPSMPTIVRHERREGRKGLEVCNCLIDEGRSLGTGLQE